MSNTSRVEALDELLQACRAATVIGGGAHAGSARPTLSATHAGFSSPSTSSREARDDLEPAAAGVVDGHDLGLRAQIFEPDGTGAGKRTLFQP